MDNIEEIFDINKLLKKIFGVVNGSNQKRSIELIFEMHSTIPRELKGDVETLEQVLIQILGFIYKHTQQDEVVLSLNAPEDFLFEEFISFKIAETGISKEKIVAFVETTLAKSIERLRGEVITDTNDIHIKIPFTIPELGFRRHYRLPSKSMLQKKVLLIVESENVTSSITKMFKYFPYDVDFGFKAFQNDTMDVSAYDVVVIEGNLVTESFANQMKEVQKERKTKFVLLGEAGSQCSKSVCACLVKPITQESIFELIISLFNKEKEIQGASNTTQNIAEDTIEKSEVAESKRMETKEVLNIAKGLGNTEAKGMLYSDALEKFLEVFEQSDLYFREIVNEKSEDKIKAFCLDLGKEATLIGAERMLKFTDTVQSIFVYDKLDMLPIYPGRYHLELEKLVGEIKNYLHIP